MKIGIVGSGLVEGSAVVCYWRRNGETSLETMECMLLKPLRNERYDTTSYLHDE